MYGQIRSVNISDLGHLWKFATGSMSRALLILELKKSLIDTTYKSPSANTH